MADLSSLLGGSLGSTPQGMGGPLGSAGTGGPSPFDNSAPPPSWMSETFQPNNTNTQPMSQSLGDLFGNRTSPQQPSGNAGTVSGLYQQMYGRAPDAAGQAYWTQQMNNGLSYGDLQSQFGKSQEFANKMANPQPQMQQPQPPHPMQSKGVNYGGNGSFNMQQFRQYLPMIIQMLQGSGIGGLGGLGGQGNTQARTAGTSTPYFGGGSTQMDMSKPYY